jgi:hypothetical protein
MSVHTKIVIRDYDIHLDSGPNPGEVIARLGMEKKFSVGSGGPGALKDLAKDLRELAGAIEDYVALHELRTASRGGM